MHPLSEDMDKLKARTTPLSFLLPSCAHMYMYVHVHVRMYMSRVRVRARARAHTHLSTQAALRRTRHTSGGAEGGGSEGGGDSEGGGSARACAPHVPVAVDGMAVAMSMVAVEMVVVVAAATAAATMAEATATAKVATVAAATTTLALAVSTAAAGTPAVAAATTAAQMQRAGIELALSTSEGRGSRFRRAHLAGIQKLGKLLHETQPPGVRKDLTLVMTPVVGVTTRPRARKTSSQAETSACWVSSSMKMPKPSISESVARCPAHRLAAISFPRSRQRLACAKKPRTQVRIGPRPELACRRTRAVASCARSGASAPSMAATLSRHGRIATQATRRGMASMSTASPPAHPDARGAERGTGFTLGGRFHSPWGAPRVL